MTWVCFRIIPGCKKEVAMREQSLKLDHMAHYFIFFNSHISYLNLSIIKRIEEERKKGEQMKEMTVGRYPFSKSNSTTQNL